MLSCLLSSTFQHGRLCSLLWDSREHPLLLQRFSRLFHLCVPAHGQSHGLIFQNMFPSLSLSLSHPTSFPAPPLPLLSHIHSPRSLFTTYSLSLSLALSLALASWLQTRVIFSHISCFAAPLLPGPNHWSSMFYELIRDDPGRSREVAKREPRAQIWRERVREKKGKVRGWRLQSNFNEHQGEYQLFPP